MRDILYPTTESRDFNKFEIKWQLITIINFVIAVILNPAVFFLRVKLSKSPCAAKQISGVAFASYSVACREIINQPCRLKLFPIRPLPDRAKLHDDVNLFGNARITSDRSKIPTVASKYSKPITQQILAPSYQN